MNKVFISGSRSFEEIPENVQESLERITSHNMQILLGDSNKGIDSQIADYLRLSPQYNNVVVYGIGHKPRMTVSEDWKFKQISPDETLKPQEQQMIKDRAMGDVADYGLSIFSPISVNRYGAIQVSSGTLRNTIQMLIRGKSVKFFYVFESVLEFENLTSVSSLVDIIEKYRVEKMGDEERKMILTAKGIAVDADLSFEKYKRINDKVDKFIKSETKKYNEIKALEMNQVQSNLF